MHTKGAARSVIAPVYVCMYVYVCIQMFQIKHRDAAWTTCKMHTRDSRSKHTYIHTYIHTSQSQAHKHRMDGTQAAYSRFKLKTCLHYWALSVLHARCQPIRLWSTWRVARALYRSAWSRARSCRTAGRVMSVLTRFRDAAHRLNKVLV
jgi:hypothetical protein